MQTKNLIGERWTSAADGATIDVRNPATDAAIATIPNCGRNETRRAIDAAAGAFPEWRDRPAAERSAILRTLADLMDRDQDRLARLMTEENGKPLAESRGEVAYARSFIDWAAGEAVRIYGDIIPASTAEKRILVLRQPVGVCAAITPWNFPSAMITRKLGPALAAGCTMVLKPSELTPLSAFALGELALEAGAPPGVFNIITGDAEAIGEEMLSNPIVRKLSFTGSTAVGKVLLRKSAENVTRLSLELGGHAPFIVFDDADLDRAVNGAMIAKFRNIGQSCVAANRFYVHENVHDVFCAQFQERMEQLRVGDGLDEGVDIGPLINDDAIDKVRRHVADAIERGAHLRTGGGTIDMADEYANRFFAPTLLIDVTDEMLVCREETFGPVAAVARFRDESEVIERANDTPYGLAAYFFTQDASRLIRLAEQLEYGIIGANDGKPSTAEAPFGGVKQSGFGREGGKYVMDEYTAIKYISWGV